MMAEIGLPDIAFKLAESTRFVRPELKGVHVIFKPDFFPQNSILYTGLLLLAIYTKSLFSLSIHLNSK